MTKRFFFTCLFFLFCSTTLLQAQQLSQPEQSISLAGIWNFKLDAFEAGISANGVQLLPSLVETVTLPGSTDQFLKGYATQGMTSLRLTRPFEYKGIAWYQKEIDIPASWKDQEIELYLERAHWQTALWVNGKPAGTCEHLSAPHRYRISSLLIPGRKNTLLIRVNNDMIYNIEFAHATSAETQTNWNGIIGEIRLIARDRVSIGSVQVYPDAAQKEARVKIRILNNHKYTVQGKLHFEGLSFNTPKGLRIPPGYFSFSGSDSVILIDKTIPLGDEIRTWDEFSPALYRLGLRLEAASGDLKFEDRQQVNFGIRDLRVRGTHFEINGRQTFIRGTVNCAEFPLTGYPATDKQTWLHMFKVCKAYGLNAMRFHTWCPPGAAFEAADETGMYLQVENADWRFTVGKDSAVNGFLKRDAEAILHNYGNHPSFIMLCEGNELVGPGVKAFLTEQVNHWKQLDPRRLYTGSAAYPLIDANDYHVLYGARPHRWKEGLKSRFNIRPLDTRYDYMDYVQKNKVPIITHEVGQWCSYPNFAEISKYTGVLKPYNYELFRELLRNKKMLYQAHDFTMASGRFKVLQNKEEIESYLRTPGLGGYHFLQLNDFPGQGTAPVGLVDIFWDPKPFADPAEIRRFQNKCVPLLRTDSFVWTNDQTFTGTAEFANFDSTAMRGVIPRWSLTYPDGSIYASGSLSKTDIPVGSPQRLGELAVPLAQVKEAVELTLTISIQEKDISNCWALWVYPQKLPELKPEETLVADSWGPRVEAQLNRGGKVLLLADTARIEKKVMPCFSGISWNTVWSGMPPNLLGILCNPEHPALRHFPTEFHSNWQWWDLVMHSRPIILDDMPFGFDPLIQMIPDWNKPQKLGLLFEARVGKGKLLVSAIDLRHNLPERPVARQLLYSLKKYINSVEFDPQPTVDAELLSQLFKPAKPSR